MVYGGYVYNLTVDCVYHLFCGYIGGCVTSLCVGGGGPCVIIGFWRLAPCVARPGKISVWDGCWFWILEARLALFPGSTMVMDGAV